MAGASPGTRRWWKSQILSSPPSILEESLAGAPSREELSTRSGKGSRAAPSASPHHSPAPSVGFTPSQPSFVRGLHPIAARLHPWAWGGKAAPALAEPGSRQGLSCGKPAVGWLIRPTRRAGYGPSIHPRWGGQGPGTPGATPALATARGSGDSQPCPATVVPSSMAGREQGSGVLAELSLGRNRPGQRVPARSQIRSAGSRPLPRAAGSPGQWADKARPLQVPKCQPGLPPGPGSEGGRTGSGDGGSTEKAGPHLCSRVRTRVSPHATSPGTQATAVTTISFYSLHLYIRGIKPSSSTRPHQPSVGTAQPRDGGCPAHGTPELTPAPTGDRPMLPSASPGADGARAGQGHPGDPRAVWRVRDLGRIHPSKGRGASPHRSTG